MVRQQHGEVCFALTDVAFQSILFLDEAELRGPPTVRLALDAATGQLTVKSRLESGAWGTHVTMTVRLSGHAHVIHTHMTIHMHRRACAYTTRVSGAAARRRREQGGASRPCGHARALP